MAILRPPAYSGSSVAVITTIIQAGLWQRWPAATMTGWPRPPPASPPCQHAVRAAARAALPPPSAPRCPACRTASHGAANGTGGDILPSPRVPTALRGMLHRAVHLYAHAQNAPRQAGRRAVRTPHASPGLRAVRPEGTASGVRRIAADRRDVRHVARTRHRLAGAVGAPDPPRLLSPETRRRPKAPSPLTGLHSAFSGRRVTGERARGVRA